MKKEAKIELNEYCDVYNISSDKAKEQIEKGTLKIIEEEEGDEFTSQYVLVDEVQFELDKTIQPKLREEIAKQKTRLDASFFTWGYILQTIISIISVYYFLVIYHDQKYLDWYISIPFFASIPLYSYFIISKDSGRKSQLDITLLKIFIPIIQITSILTLILSAIWAYFYISGELKDLNLSQGERIIIILLVILLINQHQSFKTKK